MNALPSTSLPKSISLLGYGGLLPFISLALLIPFSYAVANYRLQIVRQLNRRRCS
ncbi:hypothetical protein [Pseudomonas syringae]|uniref:hypothetical protein n=1 Tax=Pseudomonas syringae TaxID=317 RepID=UPI001E447A2B|nr:hypothetical protein [Pseudomonas syringae]